MRDSVNLSPSDDKSRIFADAHVHIHDCFNLSALLDATLKNFKHNSLLAGKDDKPHVFVLLLAESHGKNYFEILRRFSGTRRPLSGSTELAWHIMQTEESGALQAFRSDGEIIYLLAGRQIVSAEKLEILALMTEKSFDDGHALAETVEKVRHSGGLPVLPWGVGKWTGNRGRILRKFLEECEYPVFLGDNSSRPAFWPTPELFSVAQARGGRILPGTDPLPFPDQINRMGCFGFFLHTPVSPHIAVTLKKSLENINIPLFSYGTPERPVRFFANQLKLRILKYC
jgi:hypothetical protein